MGVLISLLGWSFLLIVKIVRYSFFSYRSTATILPTVSLLPLITLWLPLFGLAIKYFWHYEC